MYVLIKAEQGILSSDCKVKVFQEHSDAFDEMCRQVQDELAERGSSFDLDEDGVYASEGRDGYYEIGTDSAFVEPCDGPEWQIFEAKE